MRIIPEKKSTFYASWGSQKPIPTPVNNPGQRNASYENRCGDNTFAREANDDVKS